MISSRISIVVSLWLLACRSEVPAPTVAPIDAASPAVTPVDAAEAAAFAKELRATLTPCDPARLDALIDVDTLGRLSVAGLPGSRQMLDGFIAEFRGQGLGASLCGREPGRFSYHALGMWSRNQESWPLFRVLADGGLNYIAFRPGKDSDGRVRIVDYYSVNTGDTVSTLMRETLGSVLGSPASEGAARVAPMKQVRELAQRGDDDLARRMLTELPPALRRTRLAMLQDVALSATLADDEYQRAIDAYRAAFPGDPAVELAAIDGYSRKENHAAALAAIDRVDHAVGGDPYLDSLRAGVHTASGDLDAALRHAQAAVAREPELEEQWRTLLTVHLERKDVDQVLVVVDELGTRFGAEIDEELMAKEPQWAAVLGSPQWKRRRAATQ